YWFAIGFAVIVVIVIAGGAVLLETQAGLSWAVGVAVKHSGGKLEIGTVEGRLAGPLTLKNVQLTLSNDVITAKRLQLDWSPTALVSGKLYVARLHANTVGVTIRTSQKSSSKGLPDKIHLPLHIVVHEARIENLQVNAAKRELELTRLAFSLDADDKRIRLDKLEARGPRLALGGSLQVAAHDNWPLSARLAIILRPPNYPVVEGRTRLDGSLRGTLKLTQTLHAPFPATLEAEAQKLFETPQVRGTLQIAAVNPHVIRPDWPDLRAAAKLTFAGNMQSFGARGAITLTKGKTRTVTLNLKGGLENQQLRIAHLNIALAHTPTRLDLHGSIGRNAPHNADVTIAWRNLAWPLATANPTIRTAAGGAQITGNLNDWRLHALAQLKTAKLPQGRWLLAAHGNKKKITVDRLVGRWLDGRLVANGNVQLAARRSFTFTLHTHGLRTDTITRKLPGRVGFTLAANGKLKPLQAHVQLTKLAGTLHGHPLTGKADLDWAKNDIRIHALTLAAGLNHLSVEGHWGPKLDLSWTLQAPKLAALGPAFGGSLDAGGKVTGTKQAPHFEAHLTADKLHWQTLSIAAARMRADVNLGANASSSLDLQLKNLERGKIALNTLTATVSGPAAAERFEIALNGNQGKVRLTGVGRLKDKIWKGRLTAGELQPARAPVFALDSPAPLVLGTKKLQLGRSCWHDAADAGFCIAATSGETGWNADVALERLPLALADAYLADDVSLKGILNGSFKGAGGNGKLKLNGQLHIGRGSVTRRIGGKNQSFAFTGANLTANVNETTAKADLNITPAGGGTLEARANIPWRSHAKPTGRVHLIAHLPNLSGLGALSNAVSNVAGRLDANLTLTGSIEAPRFEGQARLSDAAVTLNQYGTHIQNGNLVLAGTGAGLRLTGRLGDGKGGNLQLQGTLERTAQQWALDMHVSGKNFRAADMPEARIRVSPNLSIGLKKSALTVTGSVDVPSAHIKPPHFANTVAPTPDLVVVGAKKKKTKPPLTLAARLTVRLGNDVHFDGYGLTARMGGQLTIVEEPGKITTASGELKVLDGKYKAYGQDLTIRHGHILFSGGPIANPGLDVRATRQVGTVTAGLQVTGTLRNPKLTVFSNPPLPQSEALAYLLFGHGVQQNSGNENSLYNQAANAIGLVGGTYLAKSLTKHVGIDTVSVENASRYSTNSNQASLFLGKYLSPKLYVSYGIGLYEPINLLRIRYTLSRHWALEAESGSISGADILFNIAH
ncbi:MAG: translocation/assembly module TamB domain-containing protein, partial [Gammaproteobacteria bacterium]